MKLIIVDDEPIVREGLKAIIDWESNDFSVCDEASDGEEGFIKIMQHNPELVIMDIKMPEMTGIELTEKLRSNGYNGNIVMLSGYSDFKNAQSALRLGVTSYLLKPVDENELLDVVIKIKQKIENDYISSLYSKLSATDAKNTLLSNILTKTLNCADQNLRTYGFNTDANLFQLVLIDYDLSPAPFSSVLNGWKINLENLNRHIIFIENYMVILLIGQLSIDYFSNQLNRLNDYAISESCSKSFILIGKLTTCFSDLPNQFVLYKSMIKSQFYYFNGTFLIYASESDREQQQLSSIPFNLIDTIDFLFEAIKSNSPIKTYEYIDNLFLNLKHKELAPEQAMQIIINCILQIKVLLDNTYDKTLSSFNAAKIVNKLCNCEYLIQITQLLKTEIASFCLSLPESGESPVMQKVLNYLEVHYNENLKLEHIAQYFNYNSSYFGKIFHLATGVCFNTYVEKLRLETAKELFLNEKLKNSEIAIRVGYHNIEYFYKKFKEYTGKSPTEYRNFIMNK